MEFRDLPGKVSSGLEDGQAGGVQKVGHGGELVGRALKMGKKGGGGCFSLVANMNILPPTNVDIYQET